MEDRISPAPDALVPQHLYKYRSLRGSSKSFARELVLDQRLYFAKPADLNDPFEFRPVVDVSATQDQKKKYIKRLVGNLHGEKGRTERRLIEKKMGSASYEESLAASYRMTMDKVGVFSMSAESSDLLMWPHYADNHAGICVCIDFLALVQGGHVPMPVTYSHERPVAYPMFDEPREMLNKAALTKGLPWAYEQEWRLILNRRGGEVVQFVSPIVSAVILGARIGAQDRADVLSWVRASKRPMKVYESRFHERDYAIEVQPINI